MIPTRKPDKPPRRQYRRKRRKKRYPHKPPGLRPPQDPGLRNIASFRRCMDLTQVQLAEKSGVNLYTLRRIEQGATVDPKLSTLRALAKALGLTVGELVGIENPLG